MKINFDKYPLPKRLRHHTSANFYMPVTELKKIPANYPPVTEKINWSEVFANEKSPDILDVGCGKGKLLLDLAEREPNKNILGIEVRHLITQWLDKVIKGEKIPNVGVLWYSVVNALPFIESNSIEKVLYLFPDPWPKKKHHKRRAFNNTVLREFHRILKKDGKLYLATDVEEVHQYHLELLNENKNLFKFELVDNDELWGLPVTNKEKFCRLKNITFYRIICYKQ